MTKTVDDARILLKTIAGYDIVTLKVVQKQILGNK
jgi:hypothetical protein